MSVAGMFHQILESGARAYVYENESFAILSFIQISFEKKEK